MELSPVVPYAVGAVSVGVAYLGYVAVRRGVPAAWAIVKGWWSSAKNDLAAVKGDVATLKTDVAALKTKAGI
jgi:hypothetical protein